MSRYAAINLAAYPISDVLENLGFEAYLAAMKADLTARWAQVQATNPNLPDLDGLLLETEPLTKLLEAAAYRETLLRGDVNDQIRALSLASATGLALDVIGNTYFQTPRLTLTPATSTTAAVMEGDEVYRARLALSPEAWSVAGPEGAYEFFALSADSRVLDVAVYSQDDGVGVAPQITVVVLSNEAPGTNGIPLNAPAGTPSAGLLAVVQAALSDKKVRPLGDLVTVVAATPCSFDLTLTLGVLDGVSASTIVTAATAQLQAYLSGVLRWIGGNTTGPVFIVGRRYSRAQIGFAAVQTGVESTTVAVSNLTNGLTVDPATGDINAPSAGSTANLFLAPRLGNLTINTTTVTGNYS